MTIRIALMIFLLVLIPAQIVIGECMELNDQQLQDLRVRNVTQVQPGQTFRIRTYLFECCVIEKDVPNICATWSVEPAIAGVQVNSETGEIVIDPSVPHGTQFTVHANVQDGRQTLKSTVTVFTPKQNPFVRMWKEQAQVDCATGKTFSPARPIQEIEFRADGKFLVTWIPFEVYVDYIANYQYDLKTGEFTVSDVSGNYVPKDIGTGGTFTFQPDGSLLLKDFWFGTPHVEKPEAVRKACGHLLR